MSISNSRQAYGWVAIALHWISAVGVTALYFLGDRLEDAPDRAARSEALNLHVSVGVLLFTFLAARLFWTAAQTKPVSLERTTILQVAARVVQGLFLLMILLLIVTGPLAIWSAGRPIAVFDLFALPSPFAAPVPAMEEAVEWVHGAAAKLFWPLIVLHVGGALKHLLLDRDATLQRMLWVRRPTA
ncbi:MAG: cytochrome b [Proteobacteria bacterium]|nr:cytochrome b [Pseudomonadota bacterium]